MINNTSEIIDASDLTLTIEQPSVDQLIDQFKRRGTRENARNDDALHAELVILTTEDAEYRANELLDLGEKLLFRVLGGSVGSKTHVNVVTSQTGTSAILNFYDAGIRLSALAMGIGGMPIEKIEDFLASRSAVEFELLLLRFENTATVPMRLTMHMGATGRTLEVASQSSR